MLRRVFLDHPNAMGETYLQHFGVAAGVAGELLLAALACAVHAAVPALFQRTGSAAITRLHARIVVNRRGATAGVGRAQHLAPNEM